MSIFYHRYITMGVRECRYSSRDVSYDCVLSVYLMTATERIVRNSPVRVGSTILLPEMGMTLYTRKPRTAEDIEKLNIVACFTHVITHAFKFTAPPGYNYYMRRFSMPALRQRLFCQNSLNQDSLKFKFPVLQYAK